MAIYKSIITSQVMEDDGDFKLFGVNPQIQITVLVSASVVLPSDVQ